MLCYLAWVYGRRKNSTKVSTLYFCWLYSHIFSISFRPPLGFVNINLKSSQLLACHPDNRQHHLPPALLSSLFFETQQVIFCSYLNSPSCVFVIRIFFFNSSCKATCKHSWVQPCVVSCSPLSPLQITLLH